MLVHDLESLNIELKEQVDFWKSSFYELWNLCNHQKGCYEDDYVVGCSCGFYVAEELYKYANQKGA